MARGEIEVGLIAEGATPSEARCAASAIVAEVTLEELLSDDATRFESDAWQDAVADITSDCVSRDL